MKTSLAAGIGLELPAAAPRAPSATDWLFALALAGALVLAWTLSLSLSHAAPAYDSAEQLVWGYALEGGYWKHPPVTSWIMHGLLAVFGPSVGLTFLATQACLATALLFAWRLGCEFMPPMRSLAAMGLASLVAYHGYGEDTFNHNTVLLAFQSAAAWFFWRAVRSERATAWVLAGVIAGAALLVKYVALFPLAAMLLYFAFEPAVRTRRNFSGLALAAGIVVLMFVPHLLWLRAHNWLPIRYAEIVAVRVSSFEKLAASFGLFVLAQLACLLPLLAVLAWLRMRARRPVPATAADASTGVPARFLWIMGIAPLTLVVGYGLATGTEILPRWGSNGWLWVCWLALAASTTLARVGKRDILRAVVAMQALLWLGFSVLMPWGTERLALGTRSNFPGAQLAADAQQTWHRYTKQPLHYLVADTWLGGNIAAHSNHALAVLVDGEPLHAAWISLADLKRCGALVVRDASPAGRDVITPVRDFLQQATIRGHWLLSWAPTRGLRHPFGAVTQIDWGILPPAPGSRCPAD